MYSLYESCKLNDLNFYDYINDVLTRLMKGETDYKSLIPCNYQGEHIVTQCLLLGLYSLNARMVHTIRLKRMKS